MGTVGASGVELFNLIEREGSWMAKPRKKCPVCGREDWNYDVVTMDCTVFCGDCIQVVREVGDELGLREWDGYQRIFRKSSDFWRAVEVAWERAEATKVV